jgi:ring-1,2-phenylacetyl-CoA epoxidase subunit PaaE
MGVADEHIRKENFVINAVPPPPPTTDSSPKNVVLRWKGREFRFTVSYPITILQAALNNQIHLPYSCRGGRCSTCTIKCISGKVKMSINEVLTDRDLQQGLVLSCVGFAETDLELEL